MDLSKLKIPELQDLRRKIDKEIAGRRKGEQKKAKQELKAVAEKFGFALSELVGNGSGAGASGKRRSATVRFRHPEDPKKTWSGRGRKPVWIKEWEARGGSLDDLRVE